MIHDITIIGGGPTGLFAAFYCGLRNSSCKIIDSLPNLGGRLSAVYPEKHIYDVAGFPKILARDLVEQLSIQALQYNPTLCLEESAETIEWLETERIWNIKTNKQEHLTKTIIISSGVGIYTPKKHPHPSSSNFLGKGISYACIEKEHYRNKTVAILGGGDSALDWANELLPIARHIMLIHRTDKFRAHDDSIQKIKNSSVEILLNTEVEEFLGDSKLESIKLKSDDDTFSKDIDEALIMFGFNSSLGPMKSWGLDLIGDCIQVNSKMETNLPGVFAAGDINEYPGKLKLIVHGFSEAATAVAYAKVFMNPKEKAQPMHSTTIAEIKEKKARKENANL